MQTQIQSESKPKPTQQYAPPQPQPRPRYPYKVHYETRYETRYEEPPKGYHEEEVYKRPKVRVIRKKEEEPVGMYEEAIPKGFRGGVGVDKPRSMRIRTFDVLGRTEFNPEKLKAYGITKKKKEEYNERIMKAFTAQQAELEWFVSYPATPEWKASYLERAGVKDQPWAKVARDWLKGYTLQSKQWESFDDYVAFQLYKSGGALPSESTLQVWKDLFENWETRSYETQLLISGKYMDESYLQPLREQYESKKFYGEIGYPQFGGKYAPFSIPMSHGIKSIVETPLGLQVEFAAPYTVSMEKKEQAPPKSFTQTFLEMPSLRDVFFPELKHTPDMWKYQKEIGASVPASIEAPLYSVGSLLGFQTPEIPKTGLGETIKGISFTEMPTLKNVFFPELKHVKTQPTQLMPKVDFSYVYSFVSEQPVYALSTFIAEPAVWWFGTDVAVKSSRWTVKQIQKPFRVRAEKWLTKKYYDWMAHPKGNMQFSYGYTPYEGATRPMGFESFSMPYEGSIKSWVGLKEKFVMKVTGATARELPSQIVSISSRPIPTEKLAQKGMMLGDIEASEIFGMTISPKTSGYMLNEFYAVSHATKELPTLPPVHQLISEYAHATPFGFTGKTTVSLTEKELAQEYKWFPELRPKTLGSFERLVTSREMDALRLMEHPTYSYRTTQSLRQGLIQTTKIKHSPWDLRGLFEKLPTRADLIVTTKPLESTLQMRAFTIPMIEATGQVKVKPQQKHYVVPIVVPKLESLKVMRKQKMIVSPLHGWEGLTFPSLTMKESQKKYRTFKTPSYPLTSPFIKPKGKTKHKTETTPLTKNMTSPSLTSGTTTSLTSMQKLKIMEIQKLKLEQIQKTTPPIENIPKIPLLPVNFPTAKTRKRKHAKAKGKRKRKSAYAEFTYPYPTPQSIRKDFKQTQKILLGGK